MKYDKPVWQIMHLCADAMPSTFRYEDVRAWFSEHYPDVNEATIRAHLIGLTQGGRAKHVQFAPRSPVFLRVARGEYEPIPAAERGENPNTSNRRPTSRTSASKTTTSPESDGDPTVKIADVILLGSVGDRAMVPAPAKEVFRDQAFQLSRLDAETSGSQWFILSAEHGLVAPDEWMSPDARTLAELDLDYRAAWSAWVVTRLRSLVGSLEGKTVRVDAPDAFVGSLFADLQEAGAIVSSGQLSPVSKRSDRLTSVPRAAGPTADDTGSHDAAASSAAGQAMSHLADPRQAVPAADAASLPDAPGLYGWFVDPVGARILNRCLMLPVRAGLVFVGQVGGSSWQTLTDPVRTLRDHVEQVQLHGDSHGSTFRMALATVLREYLSMTSLEDPRLTEWMLRHLSVSTWVSENASSLPALEQLVVAELSPPLNVDHLAATQYRVRLNQMRSNLA